MNINESEYTVNTDNLNTTAVEPTKSAQPGASCQSGHRSGPEKAMAPDAKVAMNLAHQTKDEPMSSRLASAIRSVARATSLAELVRFCGAGMIVFALCLFLMQGVDTTNDLQRFHLLLAQTGLLGLSGFAVGYILKEPRGARVFFSLGLLSIPANLAVLGAMIYSVVHAGDLTTHYPEYANWQASSMSEVVMAIASGTVVLVPMALFAFSVLARQSRSWLTAGYLLASAVLLVPVRSTFPVAIMAGLLVTGLLFLMRRQRSSANNVMTGEERFAQLLLFLPPVLMIVRSAMLYSSEFSMLVTLSGIAYLMLRYCSKQLQKASWFANLVHLLTAVTATGLAALLSCLLATSGLFTGVNLAFCLISGALLLDLSRLVPSPSLRWWMHLGWALLCIPALLGNYIFWAGAGSIIMTLSICALMITSGILFKARLVTALGVLALLGNVVSQGSHLTSLLLTSNWMTLAAVGAVIVVVGSLIERYGVSGKLLIQAWVNRSYITLPEQPPVHHADSTGGSPAVTDDAEQDLAA